MNQTPSAGQKLHTITTAVKLSTKACLFRKLQTEHNFNEKQTTQIDNRIDKNLLRSLLPLNCTDSTKIQKQGE